MGTPTVRPRARLVDTERRSSPGTSAVGSRARVDPSAFVGSSTPPARPATARATPPNRTPYTPPIASSSTSTPASRARAQSVDPAMSSPQAVFAPRATVTSGVARQSPTVSPSVRAPFQNPPSRPRSPPRATLSPELGRRSPTRLGRQSPDAMSRLHAGPSGPDRPLSRLAKSSLGVAPKARVQLDQAGVPAEAFVRPHVSAPPSFVDQFSNRTVFSAPPVSVPGLGFEASPSSSSAVTPVSDAPSPKRPPPLHRRSTSLASSVSGAKAPSEMDELERVVRRKLEDEMAEREREQEARVHRKILDLEISNASLLAINASLERAKHKQATELRDLRRRQRDGTLGIPLASPTVGEFGGGGLLSPKSEYTEADLEQDMDAEQDWEVVLRNDPPFADIAAKLEALVQRAHEAVEATAPTERKVLAYVDTDDISTSIDQSDASPSLAFGLGRLKRSPGASMLSAETSFSPSPTTPVLDLSELAESPTKTLL